MRQTRRDFLKTAAVGTGAASVVGLPRAGNAQGNKLVVWWNKGYYPEEDAAMQKDKDAGVIVTGWLEIPMPGRTYGALQRDMESKDRSRITLTVKRLDDVTKISFIEERQRWAFRGGSRLFGWAATDPSAEVMNDVQSRLDSKLKEQGCSLN